MAYDPPARPIAAKDHYRGKLQCPNETRVTNYRLAFYTVGGVRLSEVLVPIVGNGGDSADHQVRRAFDHICLMLASGARFSLNEEQARRCAYVNAHWTRQQEVGYRTLPTSPAALSEVRLTTYEHFLSAAVGVGLLLIDVRGCPGYAEFGVEEPEPQAPRRPGSDQQFGETFKAELQQLIDRELAKQ